VRASSSSKRPSRGGRAKLSAMRCTLCLIALLVVSSVACLKAPAPGDAAAACQTDADCVVSCERPNECCDQLCPPCAQVFTRASLEALRAWRASRCGGTSCPVAKCAAPGEQSVAHCRAGQCALERVPLGAE